MKQEVCRSCIKTKKLLVSWSFTKDEDVYFKYYKQRFLSGSHKKKNFAVSLNT